MLAVTLLFVAGRYFLATNVCDYILGIGRLVNDYIVGAN